MIIYSITFSGPSFYVHMYIDIKIYQVVFSYLLIIYYPLLLNSYTYVLSLWNAISLIVYIQITLLRNTYVTNLHIFIHVSTYIHRCTCIVFTTYVHPVHKYLRILYMLLNPSVASSIYLPYCYMINLCLNWLLSLYNYAYVTELEERWLPLMQQQGKNFAITW